MRTNKLNQDRHPCLTEWRAIVDAAERRGSFTQEEITKAGDWNSCAFGEANKKYPNAALKEFDDSIDSPPIDYELDTLGFKFYSDGVSENNFSAARDYISQIENRLEELMREQNASACAKVVP